MTDGEKQLFIKHKSIEAVSNSFAEMDTATEDCKRIIFDTGGVNPNSNIYLLDENGERVLDENGEPLPNPNFDPKTVTLLSTEQLDSVKERLTALARQNIGIDENTQETIRNAAAALGDITKRITEQLDNFAINEIFNETFNALSGIYDATTQLVREMQPHIEELKEWEKQLPFFESEIAKQLGIAGNIEDIEKAGIDENGRTIPGSEWERIINAFIEWEEKGTDPVTGDIIPGSQFETALVNSYTAMVEAEEKANTIAAQNQGRENRKTIKENAAAQNAVMEIRNGIYPLPSDKLLWDAFSPNKIVKIGTLDRAFIDEKTGYVTKDSFTDGEIIQLDKVETPIQAYLLLNAIVSNSVDSYYNDYVKDGTITFYVKGVIDTLGIEPRSYLYDIDGEIPGQITLDEVTAHKDIINRKTAGAIYLERLFAPLLQCIGTTPNGGRYTVLSYDHYDPEADTMTIRTPYIYKLWSEYIQQPYFERLNNRVAALESNKRPPADSLKPIQINPLFKGNSYKENHITIEIAVYITNCMLAAGRTKPDNTKHIRIDYAKIINNCPALKYRLKEIEAMPSKKVITLEDGTITERTVNKANYFNEELKKFKAAYLLIMNGDKCTATRRFNFLRFETVERGKKNTKPVPYKSPTKSTLKGYQIYIEWTTNEQ